MRGLVYSERLRDLQSNNTPPPLPHTSTRFRWSDILLLVLYDFVEIKQISRYCFCLNKNFKG